MDIVIFIHARIMLLCFPSPRLAQSRADLEGIYERFVELDMDEKALQRRSSTEWKLHVVTNITFYLYSLHDSGRIGCSWGVVLPKHLVDNRYVITLQNDKRGRPYDDRLCFFRCLSMCLMCECSVKGQQSCRCKHPSMVATKAALERYNLVISDREFQSEDDGGRKGVGKNGIGFGDLMLMEKVFDVKITVLTLRVDGSCEVVWCSSKKDGKELNMVVSGKHFCYVTNVSGFAKSYICTACEVVFTRLSSVRRHPCAPKKVTLFVFKGGEFNPPQTIFEKLHSYTGIDISDPELLYHPYRITFDIECYLPRTNLPSDTNTVTFIARHELLSVSACSNIPGYTSPKCFVVEQEGGDAGCISDFLDYVLEASAESARILSERFRWVFDRLGDCEVERQKVEDRYITKPFSNKKYYNSRKDFCGLRKQLEKNIRVTPIVGFNSQRYDVNVVKPLLMRMLQEKERCDVSFVVKKR